MALTITKLKMWKDPGYTRNCLDIPPAGSKKLPTPDYASGVDETFRPHKGSTLTSLELPLSYTECFDMSYLYIEASDGKGSVSLFGWITSITQIASSDEAIRITWDCDWWRSYSGDAILGAGSVIKCPNQTYKRPYRTQPRYWKCYISQDIFDNRAYAKDDSLWVYVLTVWNKTVNTTDTVSVIRTLFAPVNCQYIPSPGGSVHTQINLDYLYAGKLDEFVNTHSHDTDKGASIIGAWLAPLAPEDFTFNNNTHIWSSSTNTYSILGSSSFGMMMSDENKDLIAYGSKLMSPGGGLFGETDDMQRLAITDFDGNILGFSPYGIRMSGVNMLLDIGPNGGYMLVRFICTGEYNPDYPNLLRTTGLRDEYVREAPSLGIGFSIPLPQIPITDNQWSDYMVSGQRNMDIVSARVANEKQAISGIESAVSSAIGGGVTGAVAGPAGAIGGMIGGGAAGGILTGVNYLLGENFNHQLQEATDELHANQKNGIVLTGNSKSKMKYLKGFVPMYITLVADPVSKDEYDADVSINGYDTNISVSDISSFISTGPYMIRNLTVTGSIPPQAKQYIKDKLEAGVRIIENNPSGVIP